MPSGPGFTRIGILALAFAATLGIILVLVSPTAAPSVAPVLPAASLTSDAATEGAFSSRPGSRVASVASGRPSAESRTPLFPRDPGLDHLNGVLKELDDESSATSKRYLSIGQAELEGLLRELARVPLEEAELSQLRLADEPFRAAVGRAEYQRIHLKLSMTAQAILEGRCDSYPLSSDPDALKATVSRILDSYTGDKQDRQYVSIGGAEPGTGRVIQFYRAVHPEYFASDQAVHRRREERRQGVREFLHRTGKLRN